MRATQSVADIECERKPVFMLALVPVPIVRKPNESETHMSIGDALVAIEFLHIEFLEP